MSADTTAAVDPALCGAMEYRCVGPHRGGRVVAVAGDPVDRNVFYFGSTGGGVWKTTDTLAPTRRPPDRTTHLIAHIFSKPAR